MGKVQDIQKLIEKALETAREGFSHSEVMAAVLSEIPNAEVNTIHGTLYQMAERGDIVYKPSRNTYRLAKYRPVEGSPADTTLTGVVDAIKPESREETARLEKRLYEPFAAWLIEQEVCTKAIALGNSHFKAKWSTPDVAGVYKSCESHLYKLPIEIVSAEIKSSQFQARLIEAFGQACAYKLFSHRVYLVISAESDREDILRIEALCDSFRIGLVTFDEKADTPTFTQKLAAGRGDPDAFYANQFIQPLEGQLLV